MPRKYRPPAKRRSARRTAVPYAFEPPPEDGDVIAPAETDFIVERPAADKSLRSSTVKHVARDYSYVRGEVVRIVLVAGFLIVSLIITALLRS